MNHRLSSQEPARVFLAHEATEATAPAPTREEISRRAHDLYVRSGRKSGRCAENWCEAERALLEEAGEACLKQDCGCEESHAAAESSSQIVKRFAGSHRP